MLCSTQFLTATIATRIFIFTAKKSPTTKLGDEASTVVQIATVYSLGFLLTNIALSVAAASLVETLKASEPVSTALLAAIFIGERYKLLTYISLVPIVAGVILSTAKKEDFSSFSVVGLVVVASNFCFSMRSILVKKLRMTYPSSAASTSNVVLFYHISKIGFPLFLVAAIARGDLDCQRSAKSCLLFWWSDTRGALFFLANGLAYSAYNTFSFLVLDRVATTTHAIFNVFRRVFNIAAAIIYFRTPIDTTGTFGIFTAVAGVCVYARSKPALPVPEPHQSDDNTALVTSTLA